MPAVFNVLSSYYALSTQPTDLQRSGISSVDQFNMFDLVGMHFSFVLRITEYRLLFTESRCCTSLWRALALSKLGTLVQ